MSNYKNIAVRAAQAERRGDYTAALKLWNQAQDAARKDSNRFWAFDRVNLCISAVRNKWGIAA